MKRLIAFVFPLVAIVLQGEVNADTGEKAADAIVNGVHGYMPDHYVEPKEPEVRERLEWYFSL